MEAIKYSRGKFIGTMYSWDVTSLDYIEPIYNYLVYGFSPGSFFTSMLANDAVGMLVRSHPANSIPELMSLAKWIVDYLTDSPAFGSYEAVAEWQRLDEKTRREFLVSKRLMYTEEDELLMTIRNDPVTIEREY